MNPHRCAISLLVFLAGCSDHGSGTQGPPPASAYQYDRNYFDDKDRQITESFENFDELAEWISRSDSLEIYEGLPHGVWEPEAYKSEKDSKDVIQINGTYFYAKPVTAPEHIKQQLKALSIAKSSFVPFRGFKPCGGFHVDWCLTWKDGGDVRNVYFCFGCEEMIACKDGKQQIYCDIWDQSQFQALLNPLHAQRPKESRID